MWRQYLPRGAPPSPRVSHTATLIGDDVHIVGGGCMEVRDDPGFVRTGNRADPEWRMFSDVHVLDCRSMA